MKDSMYSCVVCHRLLKREGRFCSRALCLNVKSYYHKYLNQGDPDLIALSKAMQTKSAQKAMNDRD